MRNRLFLVCLGVSLGLLMNVFFGVVEPPEPEDLFRRKHPFPPRHKQQPAKEREAKKATDEQQASADALVPPIVLATDQTNQPSGVTLGKLHFASLGNEFSHGKLAHFEPHGEEICASGCAASRHPTEILTSEQLQQLIEQYSRQTPDENSTALEQLLYYGRQTRELLQQQNTTQLDSLREAVLDHELARTHVRLAIRVVDQEGQVRSRLEPTRVPLDRRHVFAMQVVDLPPLITSGTVKRVGLKHLWVRL